MEALATGSDRKLREYLRYRLAVDPFEGRDRLCRGKGRDPVLQLRELVGDVLRQQVAPGGEHLPELDENRSEVFERHAQTRTARAF